MKRKSFMGKNYNSSRKGKEVKMKSAQDSPTMVSAVTELVEAAVDLISTLTSNNSNHSGTKREEVC